MSTSRTDTGRANAIAAEYAQILDRLGLSDAQAAAFMGLAYRTARSVRRTGELPKQARTRTAIARFVELNRRAKDRTQLRICA